MKTQTTHTGKWMAKVGGIAKLALMALVATGLFGSELSAGKRHCDIEFIKAKASRKGSRLAALAPHRRMKRCKNRDQIFSLYGQFYMQAARNTCSLDEAFELGRAFGLGGSELTDARIDLYGRCGRVIPELSANDLLVHYDQGFSEGFARNCDIRVARSNGFEDGLRANANASGMYAQYCERPGLVNGALVASRYQWSYRAGLSARLINLKRRKRVEEQKAPDKRDLEKITQLSQQIEAVLAQLS